VKTRLGIARSENGQWWWYSRVCGAVQLISTVSAMSITDAFAVVIARERAAYVGFLQHLTATGQPARFN
jgi:hypothetical protein